MPEIVLYSELVEANGKTIRENNLERTHQLPLGALVEINAPEVKDHHGLRLWIVAHMRDCDGTPLYGLSFEIPERLETAIHNGEVVPQKQLNRWSSDDDRLQWWLHEHQKAKICHGWSEGSLTVIRRTTKEERCPE